MMLSTADVTPNQPQFSKGGPYCRARGITADRRAVGRGGVLHAVVFRGYSLRSNASDKALKAFQIT